MPLRYYQREADLAIELAFLESRTCLLYLGTGGGKTSIAAHKIANSDLRTLYLADSDELCAQPLETLARFGVIASLDKASARGSTQARVVVGSAQTLTRKARLENYPRHHFQRIYIDEAHRGTARDIEIADYFNEAMICGMTATPFSGSRKDLSEFYEVTAYEKPMLSLIDDAFAPPYRVLTLPINVDLNKIRQSTAGGNRDFNAGDIETTILPEMEAIADAIKEYASGYQLIISAPLVKSSIAMAAVLRARGMLAVHIDGETKNKREIIERFRRREINVLVSVNALSTGVDIPECDAILPMRPTRSAAFYQQLIGRGARPLPGVIDDLTEQDQILERKHRIMESKKPHFLILDICWQHEKLNVIHPGHLLASNEEEARAIFEKSKMVRSPQDLAELARQVQAERESRLREALRRAAIKAKVIKPEHIASLLDIPELFDYTPVTRMGAGPASKNQEALLQKCGIDTSQNFTFGFASRLIDNLMMRRRADLATLKQVKYLHILGFNGNPETLSFQQATDEITRLKERKPVFIPL